MGRLLISTVGLVLVIAIAVNRQDVHGQAATSTAPQVPAVFERVAANDNRVSAGSVSDGVLRIRLEARTGQWFPDGDDNPALMVKAFALEGSALQIPGPLMRVPEGTEVHAVVRNRLDDPLVVHGMYSRPASVQTAGAVETIQPGEMREIRFTLGAPGTYFYWGARAADTPINLRVGADTQLTGAIVVEPRGSTAPPDRVLVIGNWNNNLPAANPASRFRFVINGKSWPHTERLTYAVGDTVRMRLINAGAAVHPMHLHGFYFNVDSRGNERTDTVYPAGASPRLVVTERMVPGSTFALTWQPTRPGNWLFHCHDNVHLDHGGPLDTAGPVPPPTHQHVENHALEMMAGPVMGVTVTGASAEPPEPAGARRALRLVARVDSGGTAEDPAFGYTLHTGRNIAPPVGPYLPGPTLVLQKNQPVSITVVNQLPEPTAVHWHGIELESYFDGVAGYAGDGQRVAPPIAPGGSFDARFTPPRSGTFIYHTHLDDTRQQRAGLSGALLVVDDVAAYDPVHDIVILVTTPRKVADAGVVYINGSPTPPAREFRVGERYRLRFINVHTFRPSMRMRIMRGDTVLAWRSLAKDGMDLPADQMIDGPSEIQMGNGETYDFEFVPSKPDDLRLEIVTGNGIFLASMPLRVR